MKVYVVTRSGVYDRGCGGVFSSFYNAQCAANHFLAMEPDRYHDYAISEFELDNLTDFDPLGWGSMEDATHIVTRMHKEKT